MNARELYKAVGESIQSLYRLKGQAIEDSDFDLIFAQVGRFKPQTIAFAVEQVSASLCPVWEVLPRLVEFCDKLEPQKATPKLTVRTDKDIEAEAIEQFNYAIQAIESGYANRVDGFTEDGKAAAELVPEYVQAKKHTGDPTEFVKYGKAKFITAYTRKIQDAEEHKRMVAIEQRKQQADDRNLGVKSAGEILANIHGKDK